MRIEVDDGPGILRLDRNKAPYLSGHDIYQAFNSRHRISIYIIYTHHISVKVVLLV